MRAQELTRCALFVALTAALSQASFFIGTIPFSLGILAVFLTGLLLPLKEALLTQTAYLVLGGVGVPVFAGFQGGAGRLSGPTAGYLIGYVLAAGCISWLQKRRVTPWKTKEVVLSIFSTTAGLAVVYGFGSAWLMVFSGRSFLECLWVGVIPFLFPDGIKIGLAVLLSKALLPHLQREKKNYL